MPVCLMQTAREMADGMLERHNGDHQKAINELRNRLDLDGVYEEGSYFKLLLSALDELRQGKQGIKRKPQGD